MSAEKRSSLLNELTEIPAAPKTKNPAKAQQATAKLNRLNKTKKTKSRKEMYAKVKTAEVEVINQQVRNDSQLVNVGPGRPTDYTPELAEEICARIATGESMRSISRDEAMPAMTTLFKWLRIHEHFAQQYTRATAERAEAFQEDILDISDDGSNDWMEAHYGDSEVWITNGEALQRSRLRVETRKWLMSKMNPRKYGDKVDVTSDGKQMPIALLGGASTNPDIINGKKIANPNGQVSENAE